MRTTQPERPPRRATPRENRTIYPLQTTYTQLNTELAAIGVRLLDDAYLAWFTAESQSENALRSWWQTTGTRRSVAYAAYRAALDREEAAARDLERLWSLSAPCRLKMAVAGQAR